MHVTFFNLTNARPVSFLKIFGLAKTDTQCRHSPQKRERLHMHLNRAPDNSSSKLGTIYSHTNRPPS